MINSRAFIDARQAKKLTQKQLADLAGISQQTVAKIETGGTKRSNLIFKLAKVLGHHASYFDNEIPKGGIDDQLSELPPSDSAPLFEAFSTMIGVVKSRQTVENQ